jgi:flagellar hook protein FlgE
MSLASSLNVGVSALRAYSEGIQVVSNNIANVNTVGYKASHAQYADTFSNILRPLVPNENNTAVKIAPTQVGGGVQIEAVAPVFSQGTIQITNSNSDLAIAGNGFFRVKNTQTGQVFVTRAGNFRVDADGFLVTQQGFRVQGAVGAKTKVFYDGTTGSYDVKGPQDNEQITIPSGITKKSIVQADTILGKTQVTVGSVEGLQIGMPISGPGVVTGATIVSIDQLKKEFTMSAAGTATLANSILIGNYKTLDSGSVSITLPANYARTGLTKGMVINGPGIPSGTTVQTFSGNIKRTIPSSSSSLTLSGVLVSLNSAIVTATSVEGLAAGMILSASTGITTGAKVVSVDAANNQFTIDIPATSTPSTAISVVASGGKTLSQGSNILNLKDTTGLTAGMSVSGEGIPTPAYIGEVNGAPNLDATFGVSLVDHSPSVFTVTAFTGVGSAQEGTPYARYTVTVPDTSGLKVGDSITTPGVLLTGATLVAGSKSVGVSVPEGLSVGDTIVGVKGVPFGATVAAILSDGTGFTLSENASESSTGIAIQARTTLGTVASIADGTSFVMATNTNRLAGPQALSVCTAYGQAVYPSGNSFGTVNLAFGDETVVLSNRPSVDSYDNVSISLGTYYTPAAKVGDVKVSFDEGLNYDFYGTNGEQLQGIPLAAAQTSGPKIRTFNVGTAGDINVILSNGQTFTAGRVLLMSFRDPGALTREGDNLFSGLYTAGPYNGNWDDANIANFTPSFKGLGAINGGSLELSNVDIGEEFATMITTQRAFQAGSRVITTTDQMLEEAVNLKR